jgi:drug/metabolite transporter (DMT)-like permease
MTVVRSLCSPLVGQGQRMVLSFRYIYYAANMQEMLVTFGIFCGYVRSHPRMCDNAGMTAPHSLPPTWREQVMAPSVRGWLMLIAANSVFAGAYVAGKFALTAVSPVTLNALRFTIASAVLAPVVVRGWRQMRMNRADLTTFIAVSLLSFVLNKLFEYFGVNLSTASDSALLIAGEGIFTALLAWMVLRERATWRHGAALALGVLGVYLIIERGFAPQMDAGGGERRILGDALFILSLIFEAVASIISKRLAGRFSPLLVTAATVVGSLTVWIPAGTVDIALHGLHLTPLAMGGVLYQAMCVTVIGYILWFGGLQVVAGTGAAATLFLQPLLGTLLAVAILGETLSPFTLFGGGAIIASVWLISRLSRQSVPLETPTA